VEAVVRNNRFKAPIVTLLGVIVLWLASPWSEAALALDPKKAITQYSHDVWQIKDGLPHNSLYAILQTRDGYLWLGTQGGLARFDGVRFTVFDKGNTKELRDNRILALYEDRAGNLWIGTRGGGLNRWKDGQWTTYTTKEGLANNVVWSIYEDQEGSLWIGTEGGLNRWKNGKWATYTTREGLSNNFVTLICAGHDGSLWIGTDGGGVNRFKGGRFTQYTTREGLSHRSVWSMYMDRQGSLWVGTYGGGLNRLKDGKFTTYTTKEGLSSNIVFSIYEDRAGSLWIGTGGGGVNRFKGGKFTTFTTKEGLSNNTVYSIYEDREGSLWIGTYGGGLSRLKDLKFTTYTTKEGLSHDMVYSIYEDKKGNLWIGTQGGLTRFQDGKVTTYTTKEGLSNDRVWSLYEDRKGNLWVGTGGGGLTRFKDGKWTTYTPNEGLANEFVTSIYEDREGNLWIGTGGGGLTRFKDGKWTTYTPNEGLAFVTSLYEDRAGSLWIGTNGGGLTRFKDDQWTTYTTNQGLSRDSVSAIYEDREGSLWIGTDGGGLTRLRDGRFTIYATKEGLFDDVVYQILEDGKGNLWMSGNKGIFRVSKKELDDFAEGRIKSITSVSYGTADGMKSGECTGGNQPAGWKTRDGKLWFPTIKGVVMIDPEKIKINGQPPPVIIEQVIVDHESINLGEKVRLVPGKERFEFHYTGLSFLVLEKVKFKYQLEGFDKEWVEAGPQRVAYYTNIPPGAYRFRVIACNNDGVWNETGASVEFDLAPYFYQRYPFYVLCALSVVLMGVGVYRLRVRQLKRREENLVMFNEALRAEIAERQQAEEALHESEDRYRDLVEHSQDLICTHDLEGRILSVNRAAVELLGYGPNEYVGKKNIRDILVPEFRDQFDTYLATIKRDGVARGLMQVRTSTGERRIWEYNNTLRTEGVATPIVRGMAHDITGRWRAEKALEQRNRHLSVLNSVSSAVSASLHVREIMAILAEQLVTQMDFKTVFVWEHNEPEKTARLLAIYPLPASGEKSEIRISKFETVSDLGIRASDFPEGVGVKSIHNVPILSKGKIVGTIVVGSERETISEEERSIVLAAAAQVAPAIENARLYEAAKRELLHRVALMEVTNAINSTMQVDELLNLIVEKVLELTESEHGSLFLLDETGETLTICASHGLPDETVRLSRFQKGEGIAGWVAETGQGVLVPNVETDPRFKKLPQTESYMALINVPLRVKGQVTGVLSVDRLKGEGPFTENEFRIAQDFADQAALALANARLLEEAQEKNRRLQHRLILEEALAQVSSLFVSTADPDLNHILKLLGEVVGANRAYIFRLRDDGKKADNTHKWCDSKTEPQIKKLQDVTLAQTPWWMSQLERGKNIMISDVDTLPEEASAEEKILQAQRIRSLLAVPITSKDGALWGFMGFDDTEKCRMWSEEDARVLRVVSEMISSFLARRQAEETLRASEARYRLLFERNLAGVFRSTEDGQILDCNESFARLLGYESREGLLAHQAWDLYLKWEDREAYLRQLRENRFLTNYEICLKRKDGSPLWVLENVNLLLGEAQGRSIIEGTLVDITERKRAEEQIQTSLKEKEVLLKEIHHRVKNNLQVISSLLNLQAGVIKDPQTLQMFKESQNRVRSMALIHEILYQSKDLASIDLAAYIRNLAAHLFGSYGVNAHAIALKINVDDVFLNVDMAIPCGLIINELVSNCLKHAFPGSQRGEIHIELRSGGDHQFTLTVSDNGVGFPKEVDFRKTESLGLQLVNTLTEQLGGSVKLEQQGGTAFTITFTEWGRIRRGDKTWQKHESWL
jgi:PAS domain S-box-containing protein